MSVDKEQLEKALTVAAALVSEYGDAYLPAFLRIEAELEKRQAQTCAIDRARVIARRMG
ncbi:hypothetical protein KX928_17565 [Roseobacter sp. YSTF-M11]|uniref:Uncharacterized protein n=1 Tax=Roseobacter insulae TaxID=2859783 RepID=A0A9X1FZ51_9RHOB|nr:hypothetical protein [Roseobacter insulae]MBW4709598.1 hypothetical protein [Roseobacter insulae]